MKAWVRWAAVVPKGGPCGGPFSILFTIYGCFVVSFLRASLSKASGLDFEWIWGGFWNDLLKFMYSLPERRQLREMSYGCIIYSVSSTSTFSTTTMNIRKSTHFRGHVWARLWYSIWRHLESILGAFWDPLETKSRQIHIQTTFKNM